jgi:TetR/AcrR family transcriptional regulator
MQHPHAQVASQLDRPRDRRGRRSAAAGHAVRPQRLTMTERRQQLLDAGLRVFAERGFRGATTRQIAAAAGVTEAVIFQHFPDKDSLYAAILEQKAGERQAEEWLTELEARSAVNDDEGVIRTLYTRILGQHEKDPYFLRLMVYSALEQHPLARRLNGQSTRLYQFLDRFICDRQRNGRFRLAPTAVLVRAVLALPVYYVFQRRLLQPPWPVASADDLIETGVQWTLAGLKGLPVAQEGRS